MCPGESAYLRLIAGELDEPAARRLREHLAGCAACRELLAQDQDVWNALGDSDATPQATLPDRDLTHVILEAAAAAQSGARTSRLRLAAAILVAIGAGVAIGTAMPVHHPDRLAAQPPDSDAIVNVLGLDALADDPMGLTAILLQPPPAPLLQEEPS
jgi:predicted anti-sigma-YlaC factor YlaD